MPVRDQPRVPRSATQQGLQPWIRKLLVSAAVAATLAATVPVASAGDTSTRWDSLSESSGCGDPFTRTPVASERGWLTDSEAILGPFGTYFGRSLTEVRSHLRDWTVPNSGGHSVRVHEDMLPALEEVGSPGPRHRGPCL